MKLALLLLASSVSAQSMFSRYQPVAKRVIEAVNAGDSAVMQNDLNEEAAKALTPEKLNPFFKSMTDDWGKAVSVGEPDLRPPHLVYLVKFQRGEADMKIVFDAGAKIAGLWFVPHEKTIPVVEHPKTKFSLPFKGKWLVFWGGDTKELNAHHDTPNQRFAFDILGVNAKGEARKEGAKENKDFYAYGRQILAPADGVVTQAIDGVDDNAPGSMNPYSALGNAVVIQHAEHEVSVLAHLQPGSIRVKKGDKVRRGQLLGLCGNSGNSSEPHLHFHLQNTKVLQDGTGEKIYFTGPQGEFSPVKGEIVDGGN
jgi:hypothetical protein